MLAPTGIGAVAAVPEPDRNCWPLTSLDQSTLTGNSVTVWPGQ